MSGIGTGGQGGNILIVHLSAVGEEIEQYQSGEAHPILGAAFDLGLLLLVHLGSQQYLVFLQMPQTLGQRAVLLRSRHFIAGGSSLDAGAALGLQFLAQL